MIHAYLYGRRPVRDDPTHPSFGFDRPVEFLFAEDRAGAIDLIDPALQFSDPGKFADLIDGTHPIFELVEYGRFQGASAGPKRMEQDAAEILRPFGFHYIDEDQCAQCSRWVVNLCETCGHCPDCKQVAGISCVECGELGFPSGESDAG
jgi:hypothetical protein